MNPSAPGSEQLAADLLPSPPGSGWFVLHARPRCEKKVEELCRQQGAPAYLPLLPVKRRYGARVRVHTKPLFTGYLFTLATPAQTQYLQQNRLVANTLAVVDEARFLAQLQAVRRTLSSGTPVDVMPHVREGRPVEVTSGPLKGLTGLVVRIKGRDRVVVNVDMIGYAMAMEVDASMLKAAN